MLGVIRDSINFSFRQVEKPFNHCMEIVVQQSVGKRMRQEDCFRAISLIEPTRRKLGRKRDPAAATLLVVCDGMGGHVGGQIASKAVAESFVEQFIQCQGSVVSRLECAAYQANECLHNMIDNCTALAGMGTTLLAVFVVESDLYWVSVGDSPLWLVRDKKLSRLNEDHSMAPVFAEMVSRGVLSCEDVENDPKKHALRSSISGHEIHLMDLPQKPLTLKKGDQILLSTDGLETIKAENILSILLSGAPDSTSERLEQLFIELERLNYPYQDNTTTVLMSIQE